MDVCIECFENKTLREHVRENGRSGKCSTCGQKRTRIIDASALEELFEPLTRLYVVAEPGEHYIYDREEDEPVGGDAGEALGFALQDGWRIFSDRLDLDQITEVLEVVWSGFDRTSNYVTKDLWYTSPDEDFQTLAHRLMHQRRFFPKVPDLEPGAGSIHDLLDNRLGEFSKPLKPGNWYRARGHERTIDRIPPEPFTSDNMGAPDARAVLRGGRANPAGISYLYLASSAKGVVAEIRSFPGDYVCVGTFQIAKGLEVIDLAAEFPEVDPFAHDDLRSEIERRQLLEEFAWWLSRPVRDEEHELEYVVTQYLSEYVASAGYDGILYPSSLSSAVNLVLFEPSKATCVEVTQHHIEKLHQQFTIREVEDWERDPRWRGHRK